RVNARVCGRAATDRFSLLGCTNFGCDVTGGFLPLFGPTDRRRHENRSLTALSFAKKVAGAGLGFGVEARPRNVRFTPKSGHWLSTLGCPLSTKHWPRPPSVPNGVYVTH